MERFINILVIDNDLKNIEALKTILAGKGNNLIFANDETDAMPYIISRKIGIILVNIQNHRINSFELLHRLRANTNSKECYKIVVCDSRSSGAKLVKGFREGAVDFITTPFDANLVQAKIEVFKTLHFKDVRINQLLENILPKKVLEDLNTSGKFSPRRVEEGVVLFTDFVAFTKTSRLFKPMDLLRKLESYFEKFDEIIDRYNLEKIKTIGDAYMALAGVTEKNGMPVIRACLAALEIRNYVIDRKEKANAENDAFWDIRIGIHAGPLVSGIVGSKKISFDVWGDTVNIAARAEQNSLINNITITQQVAEQIKPYFSVSQRSKVKLKHGGFIDMYQINNLKTEFSLFREGKFPDRQLRIKCNLPPMDFEFARIYILDKLKNLLPKELDYHNIKHTLNVEKAAIRIAQLEGIAEDDLILLRTAVLFHDAGFIFQYKDNEDIGVEMAKNELTKFGYDEIQINKITQIICATKSDVVPQTALEKIMCDADHDYLGRADYHTVSRTLRNEFRNRGKIMSDLEWIEFQLNYLENIHCYYTSTAQNIRNGGKQLRIEELKNAKKKLKKKMNSV